MMSPKKTKKIAKWRREIDAIDRELKRLLLKRFRLSQKVIKEKTALGLPKKDPRRERDILVRLTKSLSPQRAQLIKTVYREIFKQAVGSDGRRRRPGRS